MAAVAAFMHWLQSVANSTVRVRYSKCKRGVQTCLSSDFVLEADFLLLVGPDMCLGASTAFFFFIPRHPPPPPEAPEAKGIYSNKPGVVALVSDAAALPSGHHAT